jgi:beta-alanine degradation protein BauB
MHLRYMLLPVTALLCSTLSAALPASPAGASTQSSPVFAGVKGEVALENERVQVRRFILKPGQATGSHSHRDPQLLIFVRGGVLKEKSGRSALWKDGRVRWFDGNGSLEESVTNTGSSDIEIVCVSLKPLAAGAAPPVHEVQPLGYPNIPGEDLLENDWVIVQRFVVNPHQWEGVHAHQPNMLWVHVRGGQWAARSKIEAEHAYPHASPDGSVGWMDPVDISVGHESGNVGPNPIDLIWVSLRK